MFKTNKKEIQIAKLHFENKLKRKILNHLRMNNFREKLKRIKIELTDYIFQRKIKFKIFQILKSKVEQRKEIIKICKFIKGTNYQCVSQFIDAIPEFPTVSNLDEIDLKLIFALNYSRKNLLQKYFNYFKNTKLK